MKKRLLFLDLDGTLLNDAKEITTRDNNHDGVAEVADKFFYEDVC